MRQNNDKYTSTDESHGPAVGMPKAAAVLHNEGVNRHWCEICIGMRVPGAGCKMKRWHNGGMEQRWSVGIAGGNQRQSAANTQQQIRKENRLVWTKLFNTLTWSLRGAFSGWFFSAEVVRGGVSRQWVKMVGSRTVRLPSRCMCKASPCSNAAGIMIVVG